MPKITEKDFGKKMRLDVWGKGLYFIPISFTKNSDVIGENQSGDGEAWGNNWDWLPYENTTPPEQEYELMSPYLEIPKAGNNDAFKINGTYGISHNLYWTEPPIARHMPILKEWPLKIVLKNAKAVYRMKDGPVIKTAPYTFRKVVEQEDYCEIEAELWIKVPK